MKILCIVQEKLGGPEELKVGDRELGALGENEVRIKIEYTAVNRADLMQRMGKYPNQKQPMNLGKNSKNATNCHLKIHVT
jgi:NADPH:quinone reductase-like Zn-dependent oxidoreductase